MAYNVRNINVLDLRPSTGVGLAIPLINELCLKQCIRLKSRQDIILLIFY